MPIPDNVMEDMINTSILISLVLLICFTTFHSSSSQANTTSPFSKTNSNAPSVSGLTPDGKYFINLQYAPTLVEKEEPIFFMVNLFENVGGDMK
jgi:hypothetical protein